jgi:hypothetical protein
MIIIKINGKSIDRKFQNMSQALAFVYQNGECHKAEKLEIANEGRDNFAPEPPAQVKYEPPKEPEPVKEPAETGTE